MRPRYCTKDDIANQRSILSAFCSAWPDLELTCVEIEEPRKQGETEEEWRERNMFNPLDFYVYKKGVKIAYAEAKRRPTFALNDLRGNPQISSKKYNKGIRKAAEE